MLCDNCVSYNHFGTPAVLRYKYAMNSTVLHTFILLDEISIKVSQQNIPVPSELSTFQDFHLVHLSPKLLLFFPIISMQ